MLDGNGAPSAEKYFVFYNPPVVNRFLGIRRSYINETWRMAREFLKRGLQTIVFANSRLHTEVLLTYLKQDNPQPPGSPEIVRGYRGGYLPLERREIERGLRSGQIRAVVATNALELGIDIGSLDVAVMAGYPGTIASTLAARRTGRQAKRKLLRRAGCVVASAGSVHRQASGVLFRRFSRACLHPAGQPGNSGQSSEVRRIRTAARTGRDIRRGGSCRCCASAWPKSGYLHRSGDFWYWTQEAYPADTVSLRSVTSDNFVIVDETDQPEVIGEVDFSSALSRPCIPRRSICTARSNTMSSGSISISAKPTCKRVDVDYFTQAIRYTQVKRLEVEETVAVPGPAAQSARRCPGAISGRRIQEDQILHPRKCRFREARAARKRNAHHGILDYARPGTARFASVHDLGTAGRAVRTAVRARVGRQPSADVRPHGSGSNDRRRGAGSATTAWPAEPQELRGRIFEPTLYLYDAYPGGIGLSEPLVSSS